MFSRALPIAIAVTLVLQLVYPYAAALGSSSSTSEIVIDGSKGIVFRIPLTIENFTSTENKIINFWLPYMSLKGYNPKSRIESGTLSYRATVNESGIYAIFLGMGDHWTWCWDQYREFWDIELYINGIRVSRASVLQNWVFKIISWDPYRGKGPYRYGVKDGKLWIRDYRDGTIGALVGFVYVIGRLERGDVVELEFRYYTSSGYSPITSNIVYGLVAILDIPSFGFSIAYDYRDLYNNKWYQVFVEKLDRVKIIIGETSGGTARALKTVYEPIAEASRARAPFRTPVVVYSNPNGAGEPWRFVLETPSTRYIFELPRVENAIWDLLIFATVDGKSWTEAVMRVVAIRVLNGIEYMVTIVRAEGPGYRIFFGIAPTYIHRPGEVVPKEVSTVSRESLVYYIEKLYRAVSDWKKAEPFIGLMVGKLSVEDIVKLALSRDVDPYGRVYLGILAWMMGIDNATLRKIAMLASRDIPKVMDALPGVERCPYGAEPPCFTIDVRYAVWFLAKFYPEEWSYKKMLEVLKGKPIFHIIDSRGRAYHIHYGPRWWEAAMCMDTYLQIALVARDFGDWETYREALNEALRIWRWINDNLWSGDHYSYAISWPNWEFHVDFFIIALRLKALNGGDLPYIDRCLEDIYRRLLAKGLRSPQWKHESVILLHHNPDNEQGRLDGALSAIYMLHLWYPLMTPEMKKAFRELIESHVYTTLFDTSKHSIYDPATGKLRVVEGVPPSDVATSWGILLLLLYGIEPITGYLYLPIRYEAYGPFIWTPTIRLYLDRHELVIPVSRGELCFHFNSKTCYTFPSRGIYKIKFDSTWSKVLYAVKISDLDPRYLYFDTAISIPKGTAIGIATQTTARFVTVTSVKTVSIPVIKRITLWYTVTKLYIRYLTVTVTKTRVERIPMVSIITFTRLYPYTVSIPMIYTKTVTSEKTAVYTVTETYTREIPKTYAAIHTKTVRVSVTVKQYDIVKSLTLWLPIGLCLGLALGVVIARGRAPTRREEVVSTQQVQQRPSPQPAIRTKKCPYCGKDIPQSALYCPYCGAYLSQDETQLYRES